MAESALATAQAAQKEKERHDAEQAARWARIEAESAARAEAARQAEAAEQFQGSGGVGSQEQLDAIRQGYADAGLADPSGSTANSDQSASSQDDTTNQN